MTLKPPPTRKPPKRPKAGTSKPVATRDVKSFKIEAWIGDNEGEKCILYGPSGIGKTTLASMCPNSVFIGMDDGGRKIQNPLTCQPINVVAGITTFQDVRDALRTPGLFDEFDTIVVDNISKLQEWIENDTITNVKVNGQTVSSFRKYGWDGPDLILDRFRLLMTDLDVHIRAGRNIILLAQQGQIKRSSAASADYLEDGPYISHTNRSSAREELKQWADHVFRIGYLDFEVRREKGAKAGPCKNNGGPPDRHLNQSGRIVLR
ncbi:hypothetical protein LCGC14_2973930 [marine sediment metagenome]|uniref:Uncharacterized protein n=1 Tax=marine sediment metagenome TaxID=412755 RepID=A0A0F8X9I6_9ZZZZ